MHSCGSVWDGSDGYCEEAKKVEGENGGNEW